MIYEYRCTGCGYISESTFYAPIGETIHHYCPYCNNPYRRIVSAVPFHKTDPDTHFNHTIGKVVHNRKEYKSELARKSDEMSERTGMEHKYAPVDIRDKDACGATDEGMDITHRRQRDSGEIQPQRKFIT